MPREKGPGTGAVDQGPPRWWEQEQQREPERLMLAAGVGLLVAGAQAIAAQLEASS